MLIPRMCTRRPRNSVASELDSFAEKDMEIPLSQDYSDSFKGYAEILAAHQPNKQKATTAETCCCEGLHEPSFFFLALRHRNAEKHQPFIKFSICRQQSKKSVVCFPKMQNREAVSWSSLPIHQSHCHPTHYQAARSTFSKAFAMVSNKWLLARLSGSELNTSRTPCA